MARAAGPAAPATVPRTRAEAARRTSRAQGDGHVVVISGLSGAGKSQASKLFEDLGYYCVDNLPPDLLDRFLALRDVDPVRYRNVALVLDIRAGDPAPAIEAARAALAQRGVPIQVLYLEASDAILVSRFSETRHRHPLQTRSGVQAGILLERERLARARELADQVIDTSGLSIGQLKERLFRHVPRDSAADELLIDILTFGFKFGIPIDAEVSYDLLTTIFQPPSPLHDGAVIIQEDRIAAAACFLPLTVNPKLDRDLGTRHRAAIGLTEECDAVAVVVSEERGEISVSLNGLISRGLSADELRGRLQALILPRRRLRAEPARPAETHL